MDDKTIKYFKGRTRDNDPKMMMGVNNKAAFLVVDAHHHRRSGTLERGVSHGHVLIRFCGLHNGLHKCSKHRDKNFARQ